MAAIPAPEEVSAYLALHQIESVIEEAVNDAVLKQVKVRSHLPRLCAAAGSREGCGRARGERRAAGRGR